MFFLHKSHSICQVVIAAIPACHKCSRSAGAHWASSSTAKGRELWMAACRYSLFCSCPVLCPVPDRFTLAQADLESTLRFSTVHSHDSRLQVCLHCCLQKPTDRSQSWEDSSQAHFFSNRNWISLEAASCRSTCS